MSRRNGKPTTIFRFFLVPLIAIMLIQSMITIGTLVVRRTGGMLQEYAGGMMSRLVENRKVILQNDMNQRWASVHEKEELVLEILERFLEEKHTDLDSFLGSGDMKHEFLEQVFPECLSILQNNSATGIFMIMTGTEEEALAGGEFDGFYIRDWDPDTNPANYTDLLLERGHKFLSRTWNIPLDTSWTTRFRMAGRGQNPADDYFYEPWRAGQQYPDADTEDLGYWAMPFSLTGQTVESYEMITYSIPLRSGGQVYGVLGVEISTRKLMDYFPAAELNESQQSGYMMAVCRDDGSYIPLSGKGLLYNLVRSSGDTFALKETGYAGLSQVEGVRLEKERIYAVACPLKLYGSHVPYDNTEWVLLGLDTEEDLFGMSRQLYVWMIAAVLVGLLFGVAGIYILVKHLTRPVQRLMGCISKGRAGLAQFRPSNILEVDALYDVVQDLTEQQKEAENILLEEKERYRVALESTEDVFFSYDLLSHELDIVNHKTMNGRWQAEEFGGSFINPESIYEEDRKAAMGVLQSERDQMSAEFRMKWPMNADDYVWVAFSGKAVYDTDGKRRKLVGSIRDIQEQKEKEAQQLRRNSTDGVTGLYLFSAGMECLRQRRRVQGDGVMVSLFVKHLKENNEKNGIVFGDMILEGIGGLIREISGQLEERTGRQTTALRLNGDEFVLWMESQPMEEAEQAIKDLTEGLGKIFDRELFDIQVYAGLALARDDETTEKLIRMARLAQTLAVSRGAKPYLYYEDIPRDMRDGLPALQGREINSLDYGEDINLVSVALNLFGKGADFPAQMTLMLQKIGRYYKAEAVLISVLKADFNSNYLEYQWHRDGRAIGETVRKYKEEEKAAFYSWLGQKEVGYVSETDSRQAVLQSFLGVKPGQQGAVLPMYDSGVYMGNICILGIGRKLLENLEEYQNLAELGRVIQGQLNQQQHDIASKAKSEFLSRMSHEIRTPMNGIIGMTAIALQEDQNQERIIDCLQKIRSSSDYLLGLINDILDMSKIESGKMKLEPVNFNMYDMVDTIRELIAPQAQAKNIDFVRDISLTGSWFLADRMRISQVLINLLGNAVKFTPERGRITLKIHERETQEQGTLVFFAVGDTGVGIAREDQERVFRSFEQSSGVNPSGQQGTGLGLSISNRLIQLMGSSIQLDSQLGEGSTFSFTILLKPGENTETVVEEEEISFEGLRILVVEDNELNAEIAQSLLEDRGFEVDCVYDGAQAVERIRTTEPGTYDGILMDIMMPVMDGLDATRAIRAMEREDCHTIPIVAMSANAFDDDLKKTVECGMNGHLSKPVEVDKLYRMLNQVMGGGKGR